MKRRFVFAVLVFFSVAGWARADGDKPFKVPFDTLQTKHIVVMMKINDKGPFRLIFDTGAPFTILNSRTARAAGVISKDDKTPGLLMLLGDLPQHKIKALEIGELKAENLKMLVMDHPTVDAIDKALGPVEGIIGLTFFAKYKMTIDYQAKEMTFVPVDFTPPDVLKGMLSILTSPPKEKKVLAPAGQWGFNVAKPPMDEAAGVIIHHVLPGSPAATAGLKAGDRLLTLEGRWTDSVTDCYQAASFVRPGTTARLTVMRDGKEVEVLVKVAAGM